MAMTCAMSRELGYFGIRVNTLDAWVQALSRERPAVSENPGHVQTARDRAIASRALKRDEKPRHQRHADLPKGGGRLHHRTDDRWSMAET